MDDGSTYRAVDRAAWRAWLEATTLPRRRSGCSSTTGMTERRVRIGYIEEQRRDPAEFERRLHSFVTRTAAGRMYGNRDDGGRLG